ncbi:hypothetical protein UNSWDHB_135 [Dehalobacter sp. UNSWDHB]|nr:hypothetical protein UNSWDHB_135 [Dehalobacter sp. UNSWDHB]
MFTTKVIGLPLFLVFCLSEEHVLFSICPLFSRRSGKEINLKAKDNKISRFSYMIRRLISHAYKNIENLGGIGIKLKN